MLLKRRNRVVRSRRGGRREAVHAEFLTQMGAPNTDTVTAADVFKQISGFCLRPVSLTLTACAMQATPMIVQIRLLASGSSKATVKSSGLIMVSNRPVRRTLRWPVATQNISPDATAEALKLPICAIDAICIAKGSTSKVLCLIKAKFEVTGEELSESCPTFGVIGSMGEAAGSSLTASPALDEWEDVE